MSSLQVPLKLGKRKSDSELQADTCRDRKQYKKTSTVSASGKAKPGQHTSACLTTDNERAKITLSSGEVPRYEVLDNARTDPSTWRYQFVLLHLQAIDRINLGNPTEAYDHQGIFLAVWGAGRNLMVASPLLTIASLRFRKLRPSTADLYALTLPEAISMLWACIQDHKKEDRRQFPALFLLITGLWARQEAAPGTD